MTEHGTAALHVGTYRKDGGRGLCAVRLAGDGSLAVGQCYAAAENASFAAWSGRHGLRYLVDEQGGALNVLRRHQDGWHLQARVAAQGSLPCYVALDEQGGRLALAEYGSGSVALFALDASGLPVAPPAVYRNSGHGPVKRRQDGPHMHCVRFGADRRDLYSVDLGTDEVLRFPLGRGGPLGSPQVVFGAPPGSGPRHLLLHPERPFALLLSELAATLTLLAVNEDRWEPLATCPTGSVDFHGDNSGGHLAWPRHDRAYVTNRGEDSIALIAVSLDPPRLTPLQHVSSGGKSPRHFLLLEPAGRLVAANEKDGRVVSFSVGADGRLAPTGHSVTLPGACFVFRDRGAAGQSPSRLDRSLSRLR
jgi:6-phosphogluconolactonase